MTFDRAWRIYADEESGRNAPAHLEARVRAARTGQTRHPRRRQPGRHRSPVVAGLAVAASVALAAAWSVVRTPDQMAVAPSLDVGFSAPIAAFAAAVPREAPALRVPARPALPARVTPASAPVSAAGEPLQLVRLRLPRQALAMFGLVLLGPDATGLVDVDVLVGEDGLPRDIRKIWFEP